MNTDEKAFLFIDTIITDTKCHSLIWDNLYNSESLTQKYNKCDARYSFFAFLPKDKGIIILAGENSKENCPELLISPKGQPTYGLVELINIEDHLDKYLSKVTRLYDMVYSSLPSIDTFLDDFLNI